MNVLLWVVQLVLAVLDLSGGAYKTFAPDALARQFDALSPSAWAALGVLEMAGALLLIVPAATGWMPRLTPVAAAVLAVEASALAALYAGYSLDLAATNPLVWAVPMALLAAFVAYGRRGLGWRT